MRAIEAYRLTSDSIYDYNGASKDKIDDIVKSIYNRIEAEARHLNYGLTLEMHSYLKSFDENISSSRIINLILSRLEDDGYGVQGHYDKYNSITITWGENVIKDLDNEC